MDHLECLPDDLFDSAVVLMAVRAVPHLLAVLLDRLSHLLSFLRVTPSLHEAVILHPVICTQQQPPTVFAYRLQNVYQMLEIADMIHGKIEVDVTKMSWTIDQVFPTCQAMPPFLAYTLEGSQN